MAMSPSVDSQITDAVTQTGTQIPGDASAAALGHLYQATAHALGIAVENAVIAAQQINALEQAATNQALILLLTTNNASGTVPPDGDKTFAVPQTVAATAEADAMVRTIKQAMESLSKLEFDHAGSWIYAARGMMSMAAGALWDFQKGGLDTAMAMVKQAAIAAVLVKMIQAPDQLEQYQKILESIKGL
jgi:hypothetical protein